MFTKRAGVGGQPPIRSDIEKGAIAAREFARIRDVPDVLALEDYGADPGITHKLVRARMSDGSLFTDHRLFPLPKKQPGTVRTLTVLNPLDELALRAYVGRCAPAIMSAIDESVVMNGLIKRPGPKWFSADFRELSRRRRDLQRSHYGNDATGAVGFFDVKNFFRSCSHDVLQHLLLEASCPPGATQMLTDMLRALFSSGVGLPIGFEGSGPLSNIILGVTDRALVSEGYQFVRWTDDIDVFMSDVEQWSQLLSLVAQSLESTGLQLNMDKTECLPKGSDAEDRLLDPGRDSVFVDDPVENIVDRLEAYTLFSRFGLDMEPPAAHFRSYLGMLRKEKHPGALSYLQECPEWVDREPRAVGDYLLALTGDSASKKKIDLDWLMALAVERSPDKLTAAGQLHACRVLAGYKVDKQRSSTLIDFAWSRPNLTKYDALGAWATRAWACGRAWRQSDAVDVVRSVQSVAYKRAALSGFGCHGMAAVAAKHEPLGRADPEIRPVLALLAASQ